MNFHDCYFWPLTSGREAAAHLLTRRSQADSFEASILSVLTTVARITFTNVHSRTKTRASSNLFLSLWTIKLAASGKEDKCWVYEYKAMFTAREVFLPLPAWGELFSVTTNALISVDWSYEGWASLKSKFRILDIASFVGFCWREMTTQTPVLASPSNLWRKCTENCCHGTKLPRNNTTELVEAV